MKNVLFATTALVATAGVAAAEVTVGGYGYAGVLYNEGRSIDANADGIEDANGGEFYVEHAVRLTFGATVATDAGVEFGASSRITITDNNDNGMLGHNRIDMRAGGVSVRIGATHGAAKTLARVATFHGFNDGGALYYGASGIDSNNSALNDSGNNILMQYTAGAITVGAATQINGDESDVAVRYNGGAWNVGAGIATDDTWMLAFGYSAGAFAVALGVNGNADDSNDIVATANYALSSATSINFGIDMDESTDTSNYGIQVSHDLGGASLIGNVGVVNSGGAGEATVAGLGAFFSF